MFRIIAAAMLALTSLGFPGLLPLTIPVAIIWADRVHRRRRSARRLVPVDLAGDARRLLAVEAERRRQDALRSW